MAFVHLHGHGQHSLLDGVGTEKQRAARAVELGQPALCLTDHAVMSGLMHHMRACSDPDVGSGIVPLCGVEVYYRPHRKPFDKSNFEFFHMLLIAKDAVGWRNLKLLTSEAYRSGFYRRPCVDDELLAKWGEGLIILTGCFSSFIPRAILDGDEQRAIAHMRFLESVAGDDVFFEIQPHDLDEQRLINRGIVDLAARFGKPLVATRDQHWVYPEEDWGTTQDIALMIQTKQTYAGREKKRAEGKSVYEFHAKGLHMSSEQEMYDDLVGNHPDLPRPVIAESLANTVEVVNRTSPILVDSSDKLPRFTKKDASGQERPVEDPQALLREWCESGLWKIGKFHDPAYRERLDFELEIIERFHYANFFLITADFVRYAKSLGRDPGVGRGSAGGSIVAYTSGITAVDPIAYGLLFERFLNYSRKGMPDIDIDFAPEDIPILKKRLKEKYGEDRVVDMIAHGTFASRKAIKDVGRCFDINVGTLNAVTKTIDDKIADEPLTEIAQINSTVAQFAAEYPEVWKHACRLQGQVATISEHPAGVVLSDRPLDQLMPVMKKAVDDDYMVTAWGEAADYTIISKLGFLKLDLLVVNELAKHRYAVEIIKERTGEDVDLLALPPMRDPYAVDENVMENFRRGLLHGVWQFGGSSGIGNLVRKVAPENIFHLAAIAALYRPATLQKGMHEEYAERRHGRDFDYWHPSVMPVLEQTYGVVAFQEQVMKVVELVGGFSLVEADDVRRIMSKEYRQKGDAAKGRLGAYRERFLDHAERVLGIPREFGDEIFSNVATWSGYGFNLTHAVEYSLMAYQDVWLKTYYPDAFYAALLSKQIPQHAEKKKTFVDKTIREARVPKLPTETTGLEVLPPDVNNSGSGFTVTDDGIRYGLGQIKGIGPAGAKELLIHRPYSSPEEITAKTGKAVNAGTVKSLIAAGALDRFGARDDMSEDEKADAEHEKLGVAISSMMRFSWLVPILEERAHSEHQVAEAPHGKGLVVAGDIIGGKEINTRSGPALKIEVALGPNVYKCSFAPWHYTDRVLEIVDADQPVIIEGAKDANYDCVQVDRIELAAEVYPPPPAESAGGVNMEVMMGATT